MVIKKRGKGICLIVILTLLAVIALAPIFLMLIDSFKTSEELAWNSWKFPEKWVISNYVDLVSYNSGVMVRSFFNSVFVSTVTTVLTLILSSLAAYAFAKFQFPGKNVIFFILLCTMMIPGEITLPAIYLMFSKTGMLNTYAIQILPGLANVFCMFMMRQYMESVPDSLIEAARLDGAGPTKIFATIMLPLTRPALGSLAILTFLGKWNDYLWPSLLLTKKEVMPIMVILPTLNTQSSVQSIPWNLIMTGCTIVTVPLIIVFLLFQEQFMSSVSLGAVKE